MTRPEGNSEFCFLRISVFPETKSRETLRFSGNKIHCSPRDQSLSVYCNITVCQSTDTGSVSDILSPHISNRDIVMFLIIGEWEIAKNCNSYSIKCLNHSVTSRTMSKLILPSIQFQSKFLMSSLH